MNKNIRRFAAAASLAFVLGSTPAIATPSRDGGSGDRASIVKVLKGLLKRIIGVTTNADSVAPVPLQPPNP